MFRPALLLASLLTTSQAWVQFEGAAPSNPDPWAKPTPKNLQQIIEVAPSAVQTAEERSISTIPTFTSVPVPTHSEKPFREWVMELIKRQGGANAVAAPGAAQPNQVTQVSPVTTYSIMSAGEMMNIPYTQTFPSVNDQWPQPSKGTIGMGTIKGEIGTVKSKRSEPTQEAMVSIMTAVPEAEQRTADNEVEFVQVLEVRIDDTVSGEGVFDEAGSSTSSGAAEMMVSSSAALAVSALAFMAFL